MTRPRWLVAYTQPARAPQKAPPPGGALPVERWSIPQELRNHHAWACWRYEYYANRWSKPPYNPTTGERAEPSDIGTWSDFDTCFDAYRTGLVPNPGDARPYDGVSFALDLRWGIVGIDLDHVTEWQAGADGIVHAISSYAEYSPSRDGYRIFCKGTLPDGRRRRGNVEMYSQRRFLTVTGHRLQGAPDHLSTPRRLYATWDTWLNRG
jgi:primase-polymerase (primpol)-like protein